MPKYSTKTMVFRIFFNSVISLDILSALCYCHKHDLLHLDVKPQNVLVAFSNAASQSTKGKSPTKIDPRRSYICKLCDFGSSMKLNDQKQLKKNAGGTVRYMSPEALRAELLSPSADIYSLGITMWQLKQRRAPYDVIQCNEVVAFQVVKHHLRPNSDLKRFMQTNIEVTSPREKQKSCRCDYYSTDISCPSKKKLQIGALDMKFSPRGCYSAGKKESSSKSPITRIGRAHRFVHLSGSKSAVRDLRQELDFIDGETKSNEDHSLSPQTIFRVASNWNAAVLQQKEQEYCIIFEACWCSIPEKRPCAADLSKQLKALLK